MSPLRLCRDRLHGRPDSEHAQALLRLGIVCLLLLDTAWIGRHDPSVGTRLWGINLVSVAFSALLVARIVQRPHASAARRLLGALHDNVAVTAWLFSCGPLGALALFVYPFVTVGNGFRYGVRYLALSGALGAAGIATLVAAAPAWRAYGIIGWGIGLSHVFVTIYTGLLLKRLHESRHELERLATCDGLTGLPNRRRFMEKLAAAVAAPDRRDMACLYIDLDGFKAVNDCRGHEVGDDLLLAVGQEVIRCLRTSDLLARLGGDEFTVILESPQSAAEVRAVAAHIIRVVEGITTVAGNPISVSASVGVAFMPAGAQARSVNSESLLKAADEAMYAAKRSGKGTYRFVDLAA